MTEKKEDKKELNKEEYFEIETKKIAGKQAGAMFKGWAIIVSVLLLEYFMPSFLGLKGLFAGIFIILEIFLLIPVFFLTMYFVWGPEDVCWATFPREGYTKGVLVGNQLSRFLGVPSGKVYNEDWDVVDRPAQGSVSKNTKTPLWGMYIFYWPFEKIYCEKTEWERYYPNLKKPLPRRELLREFTLLPYPFYVEAVDAEDSNRLGITLQTNVVMEIVNPKKALFKQTTAWPDIVRMLIKGGYVSYIKSTTLAEMLAKNRDIGADLLDKMPDPTKSSAGKLTDMIKDTYGVRVVSISVIDIIGADEEQQKAINAKAVAKLNRDAAVIVADANAQKSAIETTGYAIKMLAQMTANIDTALDEEKQKESLAKAEQDLRVMIKDNPKEFDEKYGERFKTCLDFVQRKMALDKGKFADIRTPDAQGATSDLLALLMTSKLVDTSGGGGGSAPSSPGEGGGNKDGRRPFSSSIRKKI